MKKKRFNLDTLKVKSFVTTFEKNRENTVRGGDGITQPGHGDCIYDPGDQGSDFCNTNRHSCAAEFCD